MDFGPEWPIFFWTLVADFGFWTLVANFGIWILDLSGDFED